MLHSRGFTLIELLVVISIIALLSSAMITTFASGRAKARDSAVKQQLTQMRTLMAREFSDTGSYDNLKANGSAKNPGATCTTGTGPSHLKGTYASDFKVQCDTLIRGFGATCMYNGVGDNTCLRFDLPAATPEKFSMYVYLPEQSRVDGVKTYLCMGSNGRTSISTLVATQRNNPGCYLDPGL